MSAVDQLIAGLELTVTGMAAVFVLLTSMVFVIQWMSKLAHRLQPPPRSHPLHPSEHPSGSPDPGTVSAITAAVHRYRNGRR
jgi:oxaloacetate decarboxylase gamma subunit